MKHLKVSFGSQPQPSHRPNRRYSCRVQLLFSLRSFGRSFSFLPLSSLLAVEEPLIDLGARGTCEGLGGDPGRGEYPRVGDAVILELFANLGSARRYHPPVYVKAMS